MLRKDRMNLIFGEQGPTCPRCKADLTVRPHTMSWFCEEIICCDCQAAEANHPMYAEARRVEQEECDKGNYGFPGIGKPDDL